MVGLLTGECLLVAFPHSDEVPQTGVELLHDGLKKGGKHNGWLVQVAQKILMCATMPL